VETVRLSRVSMVPVPVPSLPRSSALATEAAAPLCASVCTARIPSLHRRLKHGFLDSRSLAGAAATQQCGEDRLRDLHL